MKDLQQKGEETGTFVCREKWVGYCKVFLLGAGRGLAGR